MLTPADCTGTDAVAICLKIDEFFIQNDEFFIQNDEFRTKNGEFNANVQDKRAWADRVRLQ